MTDIDVLLFDLGGVLIDYTGTQDIAQWLPGNPSEAEIIERWRGSTDARAFGLGQMGAQAYMERFVREWAVTLTPEEFAREYRSWSRSMYPGARELLAELRPLYRLAALSNSNELHWDRNTRDLGVTGEFELAISSHQVGLAKPDLAIYRLALERLNVEARRVVFFDDLEENISAARQVGMNAFRVNGVNDIRRVLQAEQLL